MISGKTTLLKSKAVSLARSGETVSYIVMGGSEKTESVMSIATRLDFAQYHPKIKVMSQQELTKFYWSFHPSWWSRWPITPSPLSLLKFYIEKEKPQNVMVDELPLPPLDLDKTGSLLRSLPSLLPSFSSSLWLALHSRSFTDVEVGFFRRGRVSRQKELEKWRNGLQSFFSVPTLNHNLRNCNEVAETGFTGTDLISAAMPTLHAPPPRAPASLSSTSSFPPIYLPVYSTSQTMEALKYAYHKMERPTTLVLLLNDKDKFWKAKDNLTQEGVNVVTYNDPDDAQNCKTFLENQVGVLITTPDLFSGMEAANVIWVASGKASDLARSNKLRAIKKLCVIDKGNIILDPTIENGFKIDSKFATCHWSSKVLGLVN